MPRRASRVPPRATDGAETVPLSRIEETAPPDGHAVTGRSHVQETEGTWTAEEAGKKRRRKKE